MHSKRWTGVDYGFVFALSLVHALLWWSANLHEGVWQQVPATDQAHDLTTAWLFFRALKNVDPDGLVRTWAAGSSVHTPLVPLCSGILMRAFGAARVSAEAILPVSVALWIVATYAIVLRLYDRATARLTAALATSFPVFLIYSRTYLMEQPWAALFGIACWCLLATDGFRRRNASLAFGVAAGLTALSRGAGFVILAGPIAVTLGAIRGAQDLPRRVLHCAAALAIAAVLACTWYWPNARPFYTYVRQATYGQDAVARTGRAAAFSWDAVTYYVTWLIAQGPGWPMLLALGAAIIVTAARTPERLRPSPLARALSAVFAIDFAILLIGMQRQTARYFLPLMSLVALAIVRIVQSVPSVAIRRTIGVVIAVLGVHHVVALSITMPSVHDRWAAPYVRGIPLWDHRTYFQTLVDFYGLETPADDFRLAEIVRFLGTSPIPRRAVIAVVGPPHAFFHRNGFQLQSIRQHREWRWLPDVYINGDGAPFSIPEADVVIVRGNRIDAARHLRAFDEVKRFPLGDGSSARIFVRISGASPAEPLPGGPLLRYR